MGQALTAEQAYIMMKWASLALLGFTAVAHAGDGGAVTSAIKPNGSAPAGCSPSRAGKFQVTVYSLNQPAAAQVRLGGFTTLGRGMFD